MFPHHTAASAAMLNAMAITATRMLFAGLGCWAFALSPPRQPERRWSELTDEERVVRMRRINAPAPSRLNSFGAFQPGPGPSATVLQFLPRKQG